MGRHPVLPEKMTVEELANWLTENAIDQDTDVKKTPLTPEEIHQFETKVTLATAAIYDLEALEQSFKKTIKKGTPALPGDKDVQYQPVTITIPPTKGKEALEENRKYADRILKDGHTTVETPLYGIPYSKKKIVVFFNSEGVEFKTRPMTPAEYGNAGKMFDGEENPVQQFKNDMKDLEKKHNVKVSVGVGKEEPKPLFPDAEDTSAGALFPESKGPLED